MICMNSLCVHEYIWDDVHGKHLVQNSQSKGRCNGIRIACLHVGVEFSKNLCSIHTHIYIYTQYCSISPVFFYLHLFPTSWGSYEHWVDLWQSTFRGGIRDGSAAIQSSWLPAARILVSRAENPQKSRWLQPQNWGILLVDLQCQLVFPMCSWTHYIYSRHYL